MTEAKATYNTGLQVTQFDAAAEFYARLRDAGFPAIETPQAYDEAIKAYDAFTLQIEAWEDKLFAG